MTEHNVSTASLFRSRASIIGSWLLVVACTASSSVDTASSGQPATSGVGASTGATGVGGDGGASSTDSVTIASSSSSSGPIASSSTAGPGGGGQGGGGQGGGSIHCETCNVDNGPGVYCGVMIQIHPYVIGGPLGGFQSTMGTGVQSIITLDFSSSVTSVSATVLDPDYAGNAIVAFDAADNPLDQATFDYDSTPHVITESTRAVSASGITKVTLVPAPLDYVAYDKIEFTTCL